MVKKERQAAKTAEIRLFPPGNRHRRKARLPLRPLDSTSYATYTWNVLSSCFAAAESCQVTPWGGARRDQERDREDDFGRDRPDSAQDERNRTEDVRCYRRDAGG